MEMLPVVPSARDQAYAMTQGFVWLAFTGAPVNTHPEYPREIRVMQFFSPRQLESVEWIVWLCRRHVSVADSALPLSYTYCSSGCTAAKYPRAPKGWSE